MAVEALAEEVAQGHDATMVIRGGIEPHALEVLQRARDLGLTIVDLRVPRDLDAGHRRPRRTAARPHLQRAELHDRRADLAVLHRGRRGAGQLGPRAVRPGGARGHGRERHRLRGLHGRGLRHPLPERRGHRLRRPDRDHHRPRPAAQPPRRRHPDAPGGSGHGPQVHVEQRDRGRAAEQAQVRRPAPRRRGAAHPAHGRRGVTADGRRRRRSARRRTARPKRAATPAATLRTAAVPWLPAAWAGDCRSTLPRSPWPRPSPSPSSGTCTSRTTGARSRASSPCRGSACTPSRTTGTWWPSSTTSPPSTRRSTWCRRWWRNSRRTRAATTPTSTGTTPADRPADLDRAEIAFVLERLCDRSWHPRVQRYPRYLELALKKERCWAQGLDACLAEFTVAELRDLQIWAMLAWFDPLVLEASRWRHWSPARPGLRRGRQADHGRGAARPAGAHPAHLPAGPRRRPHRADHLALLPPDPAAADRHRLGPRGPRRHRPAAPPLRPPGGRPRADRPRPRRPRGGLRRAAPAACGARRCRWARTVIPLLVDAGVRWTIADEDVLARSLGRDFARSDAGHVLDPAALYRPYRLRREGRELSIVFRDHVLSDLVGFSYQSWDARDAAANLLWRLGQARTQPGRMRPDPIWSPSPSTARTPGSTTRAMAATSCATCTKGSPPTPVWHCVTVSEHLDAHPPTRDLDWLHTGSWIYADFSTWMGDPAHGPAWELLHARPRRGGGAARARRPRPGRRRRAARRRAPPPPTWTRPGSTCSSPRAATGSGGSATTRRAAGTTCGTRPSVSNSRRPTGWPA